VFFDEMDTILPHPRFRVSCDAENKIVSQMRSGIDDMEATRGDST
jgi:SpoVK/Ycf46/Vps4 family AAA+-type ATPase